MDDAAGTGTLPPMQARAGETLRAAREARALNLDEVAARTRVPLRHLQAIESSDYAQLPSPTYAVGFAKAYARAVGVDEVAVAAQVRDEVAALGRRTPDYVPYEVADPSRVPSRWLAITALGAAVAVLVLAVLWFATRQGGIGGAPVSAPSTPVAAIPVPAPRPSTAPTGGQVTLTATDTVWLRVYDADNKTLYIGNMKPGEHFDVPPGASRPMINVGRPDKLQVTLNGSAVPALGTGAHPIKDVAVDATSIAARLTGQPVAAATAPPVPVPSTTPSPDAVAAATPTPAATPTRAATANRTHAVAPHRPALTETQRANLESARLARAAVRRSVAGPRREP